MKKCTFSFRLTPSKTGEFYLISSWDAAHQFFLDDNKLPVRCYIVHATPTSSNAAKEKRAKSFLMTLYDHLAAAGIRVVMDFKDLRIGDSTYRFIENYSDGNRIILAGTKSLNDHFLDFSGDNALQTSISTLLRISNKKLIYPLLISGNFNAAFPQAFNFDSRIANQSNDYLKILENLIGWVYQDRIHNQPRYDHIWNEFYTNPNLESGISLIEAIKTYDEQALLAAINQNNANLNQEYDLSAEEIKYMTDKLAPLNGRITDLRLTQKLTPLFIAILYENRRAYDVLRNKGANALAKTASETNLHTFISIFSSRPNDYATLAVQFPEMTLDRNIPIIFEQQQPYRRPAALNVASVASTSQPSTFMWRESISNQPDTIKKMQVDESIGKAFLIDVANIKTGAVRSRNNFQNYPETIQNAIKEMEAFLAKLSDWKSDPTTISLDDIAMGTKYKKMSDLVEKYNTAPEKPATLDEELLEQFTCPISQGIMRDPVIIKASLQTFDRLGITQWLSTNRTCPLTKILLPSTASIPDLLMDNLSLRQLIEKMSPISKNEIISKLDDMLTKRQVQSYSA